jgi:hypothetical protein
MASKKMWLVEAVGHTNEAIADELAQKQETHMFHRDVLCHDEKTRDFWQVEWPFVRKLLNSEENNHLKFNVFYRERPNAPVRLWPFLRKKRPTLAQAIKKGAVKKGVAATQGT